MVLCIIWSCSSEEERRPCKSDVGISKFPMTSICRYRIMVIMSGFHPEDVGSIPITYSKVIIWFKCWKVQWVSAVIGKRAWFRPMFCVGSNPILPTILVIVVHFTFCQGDECHGLWWKEKEEQG